MPAHNDKTSRACGDFLHYCQLVDVGFTKNRMQSRNHWHLEALKQLQHMTAGLPPEDSILMLQTHEIDVAGVEKISGASIGRRVTFGYLTPHPSRVAVR